MFEKLEKELSAQEWLKANETTRALMCSLAKRSSGTLTVDEIKKISLSDLYQIDRNWTKYSNNRFGFSIQKQIWYSKGYDVLVREANWSVNKFFPIADFSLNSPVGQLPYLGASSFWVFPLTSKHSSLSHTHRPHYHYHPSHRHSHGGQEAATAGAGAILVAAVPWLLGAAAVGAAGYGVWWLATKEEREQKKREEERRAQQERERSEREAKQKVKQKVEALLSRI
ncbi:MAG: hypothetical protein Fur006_06990 [Coleofasciculaceae cyanobacterium]